MPRVHTLRDLFGFLLLSSALRKSISVQFLTVSLLFADRLRETNASPLGVPEACKPPKAEGPVFKEKSKFELVVGQCTMELRNICLR